MKFFSCIAFAGLILLTSCSGVRSSAVVPVQSKDKLLSCREILLEKNEAEQYKIAAEKNMIDQNQVKFCCNDDDKMYEKN